MPEMLVKISPLLRSYEHLRTVNKHRVDRFEQIVVYFVE